MRIPVIVACLLLLVAAALFWASKLEEERPSARAAPARADLPGKPGHISPPAAAP